MGFSNIKTIVVSLLAISLVACASGSAIVTGTKRTPVEPNQVKLYLETPAKFEVIGIVNASSDAGWTEQGSVDYAVQELKNQAAKLGANGVLLGATGESTSTVVGGYGTGYMYAIPVTAKTVAGKAIYVSE
ncbi:hypothetical protein BZG00_15590 [Salinivibrio kushneri]|uniref:Lipoprotein n=1 Tax=Salinivibrio kushneri TaxID=1908198 RepID=A0AB36JSN0_9GAMM|nr:hypothetical protein [Salinivibrio kushneri]OOE37414.1 hypothetical protein BZG00_15590 [Salinivibrio kushneri]QCP02335.1 hypothetical protein FCN78_07945 [Salinivibrio kushneri]